MSRLEKKSMLQENKNKRATDRQREEREERRRETLRERHWEREKEGEYSTKETQDLPNMNQKVLGEYAEKGC